MSHDRWRSVDTVVEAGEVHLLQQKVSVSVMSEYGEEPARDNEHRLVPLREVEGLGPNDADTASEVDAV